jgi:hypothetical protein
MPLEDINARQMLNEAVEMLDELDPTGPRPSTDRLDMSGVVSALLDLPEHGPEFIRMDSPHDTDGTHQRHAPPSCDVR